MPSPSSSADAWTGRVIGGRWKILSLLDDSGGMASVYLAEDERLPRKAVVKIPKAAQFNAEFAERFAREANWHARVSDRNVVHVLDRGEEAGTPFLVLQYLPGGNLKAWCGRNPSILSDPRLHYESWLLPIAQALDAVAAQGIVHRDVKPTNILFDAGGQAYLSDFGIVKAGHDATMTGAGTFIGTLQFMSPEQCDDDAKATVDGRSDQYGLAVTAYQVLTGWKYPVDGETVGPIFRAKLGLAPLTAPRDRDPRIPEAVSDVVMRALSPDRDQRFATSVEFAKAVLAGFGWTERVPPIGRPGQHRGNQPQSGSPGPATAWTPAKLAGAGAIAAGLLAAAFLLGVGTGRDAVRDGTQAVNSWEAGPRPGEIQTNSIGMQLVVIPAGNFEMGSAETKESLRADGFTFVDYERFTCSDESPVHPVRITKPFLMGVHEVTLGEFMRFYQDGYAGKLDCETDGKGGWGYTGEKGNKFMQRADFVPWNWGHPSQTNSHPVVNVSWNDAVAFCRWLSRKEGKTYRLPTEAEWEYACRAGTTTRFWNGNDPDGVTAVGNVADATATAKFPRWQGASRRDGHAFTAPVGSFVANPFGLHDMHGNVEEWCSDWYDETYYAKSPAADPQGPGAGSFRLLRGGGCRYYPVDCRSAYRYNLTPASRKDFIGFRVVRELE